MRFDLRELFLGLGQLELAVREEVEPLNVILVDTQQILDNCQLGVRWITEAYRVAEKVLRDEVLDRLQVILDHHLVLYPNKRRKKTLQSSI